MEDAIEASAVNTANTAEFLNDVPIHLRVKITETIYNGVIQKIRFLKNTDPDLISHLIPLFVSLKVKKNDYIYKKGQFSSALYLLFSGRVGEVHQGVCFREYMVGSYFGEVEILSNSSRKFSTRALEDTHLLILPRSDLESSFKTFPKLQIELLNSSIIKEMRTKHTLHKIKHTKSILLDIDFWDAEHHEFNKALSEKVNGLYYFNKKKYETHMKSRALKTGWFKRTLNILPQESLKKTSEILSPESPVAWSSLQKISFAEDRFAKALQMESPKQEALAKSPQTSKVVEAELRSETDEARLLDQNFARLIEDTQKKIEQINQTYTQDTEALKRTVSKVDKLRDMCSKLIEISKQQQKHMISQNHRTKRGGGRSNPVLVIHQVPSTGESGNQAKVEPTADNSTTYQLNRTTHGDKNMIETHRDTPSTPNHRLSNTTAHSTHQGDSQARWIVMCQGTPIILSSSPTPTNKARVSQVKDFLRTKQEDSLKRHRLRPNSFECESPPLVQRDLPQDDDDSKPGATYLP